MYKYIQNNGTLIFRIFVSLIPQHYYLWMAFGQIVFIWNEWHSFRAWNSSQSERTHENQSTQTVYGHFDTKSRKRSENDCQVNCFKRRKFSSRIKCRESYIFPSFSSYFIDFKQRKTISVYKYVFPMENETFRIYASALFY